MRRKSEVVGDIEMVMVESSLIERMHNRGEIILTDQQFEQLDGRRFVEMPKEQYEGARVRMSKPPVVWIDPLDAVHMLASSMGGDANAKSAILERLRDGSIECTQSWQCVQPDLGPLPDRRPSQSSEPNGPQEASFVSRLERNPHHVRMGGALWNRIEDLAIDTKRWDWRRGLFVASYTIKIQVRNHQDASDTEWLDYRERIVAMGVRFNTSHIEDMLRPLSSAKMEDENSHLPNHRRKSSSGRKRNPDWENWVAELVVQALIEGIDTGQSQSEFYNWIADILEQRNVDVPDFSKVARSISAVLSRLKEAEVSGELKGKRLS